MSFAFLSRNPICIDLESSVSDQRSIDFGLNIEFLL